jgi:hypothetical protein
MCSKYSKANDYRYIQFAPVAYIVKLNIELTMAELISKIVRSRQKIDIKEYSTNLTTLSETQVDSYFLESDRFHGKTDIVVATSDEQYEGEGIMKTRTVTMLKDCSTGNSDGETSMA